MKAAGRDLLLAAYAPLVWGSTYVVTTEVLPPGRPLLAATLRALPVGILLTIRARELPRGDWWWRSAVLGVLNIGAFFALLFVAAYRLPGGVAATAGAVQPLVVAALAAALLGEQLRTRTAVAGLLGLVGVGLLVLRPEAALDGVGVAAALTGTVTMALGVVLTKRWGRPAKVLTMTGWQLTAGGIFLLPLVLAVEGPPPALTATNAVGYAWLAVAGTALAYTLWFRGIERLPVNAVAFLGLLSPLVATTIGWLGLGQDLTSAQLVGAVLVAAAVVVPQLGTRSTRPDRRSTDKPQTDQPRTDRPPTAGAATSPAASLVTTPSLRHGPQVPATGRIGQGSGRFGKDPDPRRPHDAVAAR